jgi:hypothetical protein
MIRTRPIRFSGFRREFVMSIRSASAFVFLLGLGFITSTIAQDWKETTSQEGRFKIRFPAEPEKQEQQLPTAVGNISMTMFMAQNKGSQVFAVGYSDYPEQHVANLGPERLLNSCKTGVLRPYSGKISKERTLKLEGNPGMEFIFTGTWRGNDVEATWRVYLVKNRVYQVAVFRLGQSVDAEDAKRFFNSFTLTNK